MAIVIKRPETPEEFKSMWQLNSDIFCRELGLREMPPDGILIDRFHDDNFYHIAWDGTQVVGMLCAHQHPPYSAVDHFGEVMSREIIPDHTAEIRLFALRPGFRGSRIAAKLSLELGRDLRARHITKVLISAVSEQCRLYRHLGFQIIGDPIEERGVQLYPMTANVDNAFELLCRIYHDE